MSMNKKFLISNLNVGDLYNICEIQWHLYVCFDPTDVAVQNQMFYLWGYKISSVLKEAKTYLLSPSEKLYFHSSEMLVYSNRTTQHYTPGCSNFATARTSTLTICFWTKLFYSDKATFHLSGKVSHHNLNIWGSHNLHQVVEHVRDSPKVLSAEHSFTDHTFSLRLQIRKCPQCKVRFVRYHPVTVNTNQ
jgi:hypothetical protein